MRAIPQAAGQVFNHTPWCQQTCRGHRVRATTPLRRILRHSASDPWCPRQGHGEWEGVHRRAHGSPRSLRRRSRSLLQLTFWSFTNGPDLIRSGVHNSEPPRAAASRSCPLRAVPAPRRCSQLRATPEGVCIPAVRAPPPRRTPGGPPARPVTRPPARRRNPHAEQMHSLS